MKEKKLMSFNIITTYKELFNLPMHGKFDIEIAGGNRICRGCNGTINKNKKCLAETYLIEQRVRRGKTLPVYKKLSYCRKCAIKRIDLFKTIIEKEFINIETIKINLGTVKSGRYALLINN